MSNSILSNCFWIAEVERAFISTLLIFPYCRFITKFNDNSYVFTLELVRQVVVLGHL